MKKIIAFLFVISLVYVICTGQSDDVLLPNDAIRYRIVANSNSVEDQNLKWQVNEKLINIIAGINTESSASAKESINQNLDLIKNEVNSITLDNKVSFGQNYFPKKTYAGKTYDAGYYESLVITLGSGNGDNFWCVLFPPLCLIEYQKTNIDKVTYDFYIKEIINKYL